MVGVDDMSAFPSLPLPQVPQFGPLFDGALVDRSTVAALVRATAINGLRAQRNPLIGYRGR